MPSTLVNDLINRFSTVENELSNADIIEKSRETVLYDSVVNDKLNENSPIKRDFYEQIVLAINQFYKVGDFVYMKNAENKKSIIRIDKIWKENE
jgi:hypothetical protein